ncbi:FeoA family protein [Paenibacillus sp. IHBB 10380]|uniref:FeoA family protein n=1 Tax=Paenibacillus sp. IHBB 10380 TaxID=1566358 RepID=UPI000A600F6D|nr:FeoA family protein [Paenibacillus sp. IHBB 10380]
MPLTMLSIGKSAIIKECRGKDSTKKFLEGLGMVPGTQITVISENGGNLIVRVKDSRLAIGKGVAQQLWVVV